MSFLYWTDKAGAFRTLYFDAVISETQDITSQVTEHPVEKGANITDHVRAEIDRVHLEVFVSNTPNRDVNGRGAAVEGVELDLKKARETASVFKFGTDFDAVSDMQSVLRDLRDSATLVTIATSSRDYEDMILAEISQKKDGNTGTSASFDLNFRQIRTVETKLVKVPTPKETRGKHAVNKGAQDPVPANDQAGKKTFLASLLDRALK